MSWRQPFLREWFFVQGDLNYLNDDRLDRSHYLSAMVRLEAISKFEQIRTIKAHKIWAFNLNPMSFYWRCSTVVKTIRSPESHVLLQRRLFHLWHIPYCAVCTLNSFYFWCFFSLVRKLIRSLRVTFGLSISHCGCAH